MSVLGRGYVPVALLGHSNMEDKEQWASPSPPPLTNLGPLCPPLEARKGPGQTSALKCESERGLSCEEGDFGSSGAPASDSSLGRAAAMVLMLHKCLWLCAKQSAYPHFIPFFSRREVAFLEDIAEAQS